MSKTELLVIVLLVLGVLLFFWIGLGSLAQVSSPSSVSSSKTGLTARFAGVSLNLELATTPAERQKGLSARPTIPNDYGMLMVFPKDGTYGIWMKNTFVPLDVFWLDDKGRVVYMVKDMATDSYPHVFYPSTPARYVLEVGAGFAVEHQVTLGTPLLLKNLPTVLE